MKADASRFETRFHLKYDEELIRVRFLDDELSCRYGAGLRDISLPINEFRSLNWEVKSVFIVENKVNFLTFPHHKNAIVIFGHGYGVSSLQNITFLQNALLYYWGDLDAQGFEILSQFRGYFQQVQSILMDSHTFDLFFENDPGMESKVSVDLNLNSTEQALYQKLKSNN